MTRLILMRHSGTVYRNKTTFAGITDFPLDKHGVERAADIARTLRNEEISAVYSSTLSRAYDTAKPVAEIFGLGIEKVKEFNELDFGILEGLTFEQAKERFPDIFNKRQEDPWEFVVPQGESYKDGAERAYPKMLELIKKHEGQTFIVVCHGCIMKSLLVMLTGKPYSEIRQGKFHFGCRMFINIDGGKVRIERTEGVEYGVSEIA
jgi:alpha-ribazole phosphatase